MLKLWGVTAKAKSGTLPPPFFPSQVPIWLGHIAAWIQLFTRGSRPALPGIQNIQQSYFFVNLQPHRWNPDLFNSHDYFTFWRHLTNFEAHLKSVKKFEIWPQKLKFFFPSAFLMEGMNSKTTKPTTIPINRVFERYVNHCCWCPKCRVYPGHNRDLISSRD